MNVNVKEQTIATARSPTRKIEASQIGARQKLHVLKEGPVPREPALSDRAGSLTTGFIKKLYRIV